MFLLRSALVITVLFATSAFAREWSDATGKFKIVADLLDASANSIGLKKPTGQMRCHVEGIFVEPAESEVVTTTAGCTGDTTAPTTENTANAVGAGDVGAGGDVRAGLVNHWRFDETKGDVGRDSQGNVNASLSGWEREEPRWVKGKIRNGLQFSGPENFAVLGKGINYPQFTITFWLNTQLEKGTNPRILTPWVGLNYEKKCGVGVLGDVMEPTKPEPGEWYHYAVAIDVVKRRATIYRNGAQVAEGKIMTDPGPGNWMLGHNQDPRNHGDTFNGILDDLRIYKRLLEPKEVEQLAGVVAE